MYVRGFAKALPSWKVTAGEVAEWTGGDQKFISEKIGIDERQFLAPNESLVSLASAAVKNLKQKYSDFKVEDVELLVLVTQNPDYRLPHSSALLQSEIGIPNSCACFDISLGCSGWVYSLTVVKAMMQSEGYQNALLVTCDPYSRIMNRADKATVSIFGDAASVTWMSDQGASIGRADFGTDGSQGENLIMKVGGSRNPLVSLLNDTPPDFAKEDSALFMNGRAILEFMMNRVPDSVELCVRKNELRLEDIDLFVFHQASAFMLKQLARQMGLTPEKVPINISHLGNTVSSTIPIALESLEGEGKLKGKKVMVSGFGVGLSWATNILSF